mgnify:CR=1 FL=1
MPVDFFQRDFSLLGCQTFGMRAVWEIYRNSGQQPVARCRPPELCCAGVVRWLCGCCAGVVRWLSAAKRRALLGPAIIACEIYRNLRIGVFFDTDFTKFLKLCSAVQCSAGACARGATRTAVSGDFAGACRGAGSSP